MEIKKAGLMVLRNIGNILWFERFVCFQIPYFFEIMDLDSYAVHLIYERIHKLIDILVLIYLIYSYTLIFNINVKYA